MTLVKRQSRPAAALMEQQEMLDMVKNAGRKSGVSPVAAPLASASKDGGLVGGGVSPRGGSQAGSPPRSPAGSSASPSGKKLKKKSKWAAFQEGSIATDADGKKKVVVDSGKLRKVLK